MDAGPEMVTVINDPDCSKLREEPVSEMGQCEPYREIDKQEHDEKGPVLVEAGQGQVGRMKAFDDIWVIR